MWWLGPSLHFEEGNMQLSFARKSVAIQFNQTKTACHCEFSVCTCNQNKIGCFILHNAIFKDKYKMMMQRCRVHTWQGWGGRRKQKRIDLCDLKSSIWTSLAREKVRRQKKARTIKNGSWLSIWSKHEEVDWYSELRLYHSINMRREGEGGGCKFNISDGWSLPPFTTSDTLNVKENLQYNVLDRKGSDEC